MRRKSPCVEIYASLAQRLASIYNHVSLSLLILILGPSHRQSIARIRGNNDMERELQLKVKRSARRGGTV